MRYLSLFSGMEAAHLALASLGWECAGVAEIEPAPCAVLAHRLAHVPNLGSVIDITDDQIAALGAIDVVIGGSPCQDLSIAGNRAGLAGARSGLFHEQTRIFDAARSRCGARWLVWENVPGAFSSNRGRDFALVVGALSGCEFVMPADEKERIKWETEGVALGPRGFVEWCVLDAQWFGLAQRRKRVFVVLDTGNWPDRSPVLLEPESLRGDSPPSRETREDVAGTISARTSGGGGLGTDFDLDGGLVPAIAGSPTRRIDRGGVNSEGNDGHLIPVVPHCLNAGAMDRIDAESETLIPVIGVDCYNGALTGDVAHTIRKGNGNALGGVPSVIAFDTTQVTHPENRSNPQPGDPCHPLVAAGHAPVIAYGYRWAASANESMSVDEIAPPVRAGRNGEPAVGVRRLTPRECERLQGAPDDWTLVPDAKGKPLKDSPRYKMVGNSFAVYCVRWIGRQIARATEQSARRERTA